MVAAAPHGSHCMNHISSREAIASRQFRIAGLAAVKSTALFSQSRSRRPMDGAADSFAREQRFVGGIHDGVNVECGDISLDAAKGGDHLVRLPWILRGVRWQASVSLVWGQIVRRTLCQPNG